MSVFLAMALSRIDAAPSSSGFWRPHMRVEVNRSYFRALQQSRREINTGTWRGIGLLEDASATQLSVSRVYSATSLIIPKRS